MKISVVLAVIGALNAPKEPETKGWSENQQMSLNHPNYCITENSSNTKIVRAFKILAAILVSIHVWYYFIKINQ